MRGLAAALCLCAALWPLTATAEESAGQRGEPPQATPPAPAPVNAPDAARNPLYVDLDALFLLQDATARGSQDAAALQKPLLLALGAKLAEQGKENPDELAPLVAGYVLSGGDPAVAEQWSRAEALRPASRNLLKGVFLFMEGDRAEAATLLKPIDPALLPARIAGRVALAQALLEKDPPDRQHGLSRAIAFMPGTLVEESALRRSALAFAEAHDEAGFWKRLERYQRRFPNSLYARSFWEESMREILKWNSDGNGPDLARLDAVLQEMPAPRRRSLYLHLARLSVGANNASLAVHAARRVGRLAVAGSLEHQVAKLYRAVYAVASENAGEALADLQSVDGSLLNAQEQAMLEAGLAIARQINHPPEQAQDDAAAGKPEISPLLARGEGLLAEIEKLLSEQGS